MKNLILIIVLSSTLICFSQKKQKETVYLFFDIQSDEKCKIPIEGKGYQMLNKFRKEYEDYGKIIKLKICDEIFFSKKESFKDTCSIKALKNIKLVELDYLIKKYELLNKFKHQVFSKIYFIEKISKNKIIKYEVTWHDDILMID